MLWEESKLDHFLHALLSLMHFLLLFLLLVLATGIRGHLLELILLEGGLFPHLLKLFFFLALVDLLGLCSLSLFAVFVTLGARLIAELDPHDLVNEVEDGAEHFQGLVHRLIGLANVEAGTHEDGILVVDLLVGHVQLVEAIAMLRQQISNRLVDQLVGHFFVLTEHNQKVFLCHRFGLLLVGGRGRDGKVRGTDREEQSFEVLVEIVDVLLARFLG